MYIDYIIIDLIKHLTYTEMINMAKLKACLAALPPGVPKKNRYRKIYDVLLETAFPSVRNINY